MPKFADALVQFPPESVTYRTWAKTDPVPDTIKLYVHFEPKLSVSPAESRHWLFKTTEEAGKTHTGVFEATQVDTRVSDTPVFVLEGEPEKTDEYSQTINALIHLISRTDKLVVEEEVNPWT